MRHSLTWMVLAGFALVACGDDPVSYSAPVGINLKAKSDDVVGGVITEDKGITTESGNPYGAFITAAKNELGGRDPGVIELDQLTMTLGATSTGVTLLEEVFSGNVQVQFQMNDTDNFFAVGHVMDPTGSTTDLVVDFDSAQFAGVDWTKLLGGSFKVVMSGPAGTDFETKGADADLQLTFTFEAFE